MTPDSPPRPVLFDLGGTIIDFSRSRPYVSWEDVAVEAIGSFVDGWLSPGDVARMAHVYREQVLRVSRAGPANADVPGIWHDTLKRFDVGLDEPIEQALVNAYCRAVTTGCVTFQDVVPTLWSLRRRGHPLALVSNVYEPARYWQECIRSLELADLFDVLTFSSDVGWQKPDRRIFRRALEGLGQTPDGAVFVGDDLYTDVYGASQLGMTTVWVRGPTSQPERLVEPTHEVDALGELLQLIPTVGCGE